MKAYLINSGQPSITEINFKWDGKSPRGFIDEMKSWLQQEDDLIAGEFIKGGSHRVWVDDHHLEKVRGRPKAAFQIGNVGSFFGYGVVLGIKKGLPTAPTVSLNWLKCHTTIHVNTRNELLPLKAKRDRGGISISAIMPNSSREHERARSKGLKEVG